VRRRVSHILLVCTFALCAASCGPPTDDDSADGTGDGQSWAIYDGDLPSDFPFTIGHYWPPGSEFAAITVGEPVEIVQGIQGGVHTEIALEFDLGLGHADIGVIHFDLRIQTLLDGTEVVADLELDGFKAGNMGFGVFRTQTLPVIFEQDEAVFYEGRQAVIVAQVLFDDEASGQAAPVLLVDTRNDLEDL